MAIRVDLKDRKILAELDADARQPYSQIAKKVGLSQQVVSYRVARLFSENVIKSIVTFINLEKLGYRTYNICLELKHMTSERRQELIERLQGISQVQWLASTQGTYNLIIGVNAADMDQFQFLFNQISSVMEHEIVNDGMFICMDAVQMPYPLIDGKKRPIEEAGSKVGYGGPYKLQPVDYSILRELAANARITNDQLARTLKTGLRTIRDHIERLQHEGVIVGFKPLIDMSKLGYQWHLVLFKLKYVDPATRKNFTEFLKTLPQTFFVVNGVGNWNMQVEFYCKDDEEYNEVMTSIFPEQFHSIIKNKIELRIIKEHKCVWYPSGKIVEAEQTELPAFNQADTRMPRVLSKPILRKTRDF